MINLCCKSVYSPLWLQATTW